MRELIRRKPCRPGDKVTAPIHRLRQLRKLNGLAWDGTETSANGDGEDGQNEPGQRGAAAQTVSDPGQGDGGVLETQENLMRAVRGLK